jgi:hypothetical protein
MSKELQPEQIVSLYTEFGNYERHFNQIQSGYRAIASQWLLAAFAGMGYILTQDHLGGYSSEFLAALLSFLASIGLLLLWNLDVNVYHRLLVATFEAGLVFEQQHGLPDIRIRMNQHKVCIANSLRNFYLMSVLVMLAIAFSFSFCTPISMAGVIPIAGLWFMWEQSAKVNATSHE